MTATGVRFVDCAESDTLALVGERRYYRLTCRLSALENMIAAPFSISLQTAALDLFQRFQDISGNTVSPLLPAPSVDDSWIDGVDLDSTNCVTFDLVTLGGASLQTCGELTALLATATRLYAVQLARADADEVTGPDRVARRDAANAAVEAGLVQSSMKTKIDDALATAGTWAGAVLVVAALVALAVLFSRGKNA